MTTRLLHTLFGDPTEALEDRGDELRLSGFHREAAWYYRQALQRLGAAGSAARRQALGARFAECRASALRQILEEAETMRERGRRREALALLSDAERFAEGAEERIEVQGRRQSLMERPERSVPASQAPAAAGSRRLPGPGPLDSPGPGSEGGGHDPSDSDREDPSGFSRFAVAPGVEPDRAALREIARDPDAAVLRFTEETRTHPESAIAHEFLAEALKATGKPLEARVQYEAAYRRNPERLRVVVESARLTRDELADPAGALLRLEQACRRHRPTGVSLPLHLERLLLLARLKRRDEALAGFAELLSVSGLDRGALHFNRAGVLEQAEELAAARADLEAAIQLAPDNLLYRERLADLCVREREPLELGLRHLEEALELAAHDFARPSRGGFSPDRARLTYKAARILYLLERDEEARDRIEEAMIVCRDPRVQEALLELRRDLGN